MLGDYWACIHRDKTKSVPMFLDDFQKFVVMDACAPVPKDVKEYDVVVPMEYSEPPLDVLIWVSANLEGKGCILSNYPYIRDGGVSDFKVFGVRQWEENIEGLVYGSIGDFNLAFFDALFPISWDRYVEGETIPISLSGLGKSVHRLSTLAEASNRNPDSMLQTNIEHVLNTGESKLMSLCHLADKENIDDHFMLLGKVLEHSVTDIHEITIHRITMSLIGDVVIPIVFGETSIDTKDWQPEVGEFIAIAFFLQGIRPALKLKHRGESE